MALASEGEAFPPQNQEKQPGKEHVMEPTPQTIHPDYKPAGKLEGKVAIVTGGDSGIGRTICLSFVLEGAIVAFTYVAPHKGKNANDTLQMLKEARKGAVNTKDPIAIECDLGYENNCKKVVDEVINAFGQVDILVNNVAESHMTPSVDDVTEEQLDQMFRTNIFSYLFMSRHAVKHMKEGGSIINTASVDAYAGNPQFLSHCTTKGAIVAFTRGLALQLVEKGTQVNGVAPGPIWTPLIPAANPPDVVAQFGKSVPMRRAAQPSEVAPCYVFLASNDASNITGKFVHPNGGLIVNA